MPGAPRKRTTQYFEMLGNRAIYHEGWVACTTPVSTPWDLGLKPSPDVITGYNWDLYNIKEDFSQFNDLAAEMPDKLKQMQDLFYVEAKKNDVLPLDNSTLARFLTPRPGPTAGRTEFTYSGELLDVPTACAPSILGRSFNIETQVDIPEGGAEGMIVTEGGRFGGYGLFLSKGEFDFGRGKVVFLYNLLGLKRIAWEGPRLKPGKHTIAFSFKYEPDLASGARDRHPFGRRRGGGDETDGALPNSFSGVRPGSGHVNRLSHCSSITTTARSSSPARSIG